MLRGGNLSRDILLPAHWLRNAFGGLRKGDIQMDISTDCQAQGKED